MHKLLNFTGTTELKPAWQSVVISDDNKPIVKKIEYDFYSKYPIYIADDTLSEESCSLLIRDFESQRHHPVGVDGYGNSSDNVGSYRANAWAEELSITMSDKLFAIMDETNLFNKNGTLYSNLDFKDSESFTVPFYTDDDYKLLGSTPWMRFMKYKSGGMHTPHHDAPFKCAEEGYITLFSWVLYLNTPDGEGGHFQFVNDLKQKGKHPHLWDTSDWTNMASDITLDVAPKRGRLLIFPHWLCHQVQQYMGEGYRYIIRGDIAYGNQ